MSAERQVNLHPTLEEFQGWYNLGYDRNDGYPVLHSQQQVPEFEPGEFFHLYVAENSWFEQLVPPSALKPYDPLAEPPMYVVSDADDRSLDVCPNFDYLTLELIRRIQKEFLGRHPLWRVILHADDPSCNIMIYPDAIRFGNLPSGANPEQALAELIPRAIAASDAFLRPARAQLAFLQGRLPDAIRAIGDRPFYVAGVLDNYEGNYDRLVIFLLIRGPDDRAFGVDRPAGVDKHFLSRSGGFGVDAEGTVISRIEIPESAAFCVALWCPRADYRGPLTIIERETGKRHTYELKSENITRTRPVQ